MRLHVGTVLLLASALLLLCLLIAPTPSEASPSHSHTHGPLPSSSPAAAAAAAKGKSHRVSRSSYHTSRGRDRSNFRSYEGQGTSHTVESQRAARRADPHSADSPPEGQHLSSPQVHEQLRQVVRDTLGEEHLHLLPSRRAAETGEPEQVKTSITARAGEVVFNWLTWTPTQGSAVQISAQPNMANASTIKATRAPNTFVDTNTLHLVRYVHDVLVPNLNPGSTYFYRVGDQVTGVWSPVLEMRTLSTKKNDVANIAVYGDLGLVNAVSMQKLSEEVAEGTVDMVIHVGDIAYNMDEIQGVTGDVFFNEVQNITSVVPFMGCAGNHEEAWNFSHYTNRFTNWNYVSDPRGVPDNNWWFSYDVMSGGVLTHFIALDSEIYYDQWNLQGGDEGDLGPSPPYGPQPAMIAKQWDWLVADIARAYDSGKYAWMVAYSHRPMYCSNVDDDPNCSTGAQRLREGLDGKWGLEKAFATRPGAIDLYLTAHEHSYERTYPVFNGDIDWASVRSNGTSSGSNMNAAQRQGLKGAKQGPAVYVDQKYPTHIIAGSSGCREYFDEFNDVFFGPWSAFRSSTYGYGVLQIHNATHMHWEQLIDEGNAPSDELWMIKTKPRGQDATQQEEQQQRHRRRREEPVRLESAFEPARVAQE